MIGASAGPGVTARQAQIGAHAMIHLVRGEPAAGRRRDLVPELGPRRIHHPESLRPRPDAVVGVLGIHDVVLVEESRPQRGRDG